MVSNSIYSSLSKDDMLAELKLQLSSPNNIKKTFVILEGVEDITLFSPLLSKDCSIFESYGGKQALEETINTCFQDKRVIGIRDRDYLLTTSNNRIFFCDYCNAEMMIISNEQGFSNVLLKILREQVDCNKIRDEILESLLILSAMRKANEENSWGITLKDISIPYILSICNPIVVDNLIEHINRKSKNTITLEKRKVIIDEANKIKGDLLNYTNGHDFCAALIDYLKKRASSNPSIHALSKDTIHIFLSLGYNIMYFAKTNLYKSLYDYQNQNDLKIVI